MLDKTTTPEEEKNIYYGYFQIAAFCNNLNYTKEFMVMNGIPSKNVICINVDNNIEKTKNSIKKAKHYRCLSDISIVSGR